MKKIDSYAAGSGRKLREDDSVVNIADIVSAAFNKKTSNFEQLAIDGTAGGIGLTAAKYGTLTRAVITVENASIRFRVDGTAPTAAIGHFIDTGDQIELESHEDIVNFKAIRTGSTSAIINVSYSN